GDDGLVHVWDAATGADLHALAGHTSWLEALACGPGGLVVTASGDRTVRAWDGIAGRALRTFQPLVPDLTSVALSPDARSAAAGASSGALCLWAVDTGQLAGRRDFRHGILAVAFAPEGR